MTGTLSNVESADCFRAPAMVDGVYSIELSGVNKGYDTPYGYQKVLFDVNMKIRAGSITGIVGASGAGKTTVLRCISGLEIADSGSVKVNGFELTGASNVARRKFNRSIGMIFQGFNLLSRRTAIENVMMPLEIIGGFSKEEMEKKAMDALNRVGMEAKAQVYPASLSGGQKQRVAIARAVVSDAKVLFCDEATSALDPKSTESVLSLLQALCRDFQITVVMVTHEVEVVKSICDYVYVMQDGGVVEENNTYDIFMRPQTEDAKSVLWSIFDFAIPDYIKNVMVSEEVVGGNVVVRLLFPSHSGREPLVAQFLSSSNVDVSIIGGLIDNISGEEFGILLLTMKQADLKRLITWSKSCNVEVDIEGYYND